MNGVFFDLWRSPLLSLLHFISLRSIHRRTFIFYLSHLDGIDGGSLGSWSVIKTVVSAEETEEDCEQSYGFMALGNMFLIWFMDFSCSRQRCIYLPKVSFFSKSLPLNRRWFVSFHARSTPLRYAYYGYVKMSVI